MLSTFSFVFPITSRVWSVVKAAFLSFTHISKALAVFPGNIPTHATFRYLPFHGHVYAWIALYQPSEPSCTRLGGEDWYISTLA